MLSRQTYRYGVPTAALLLLAAALGIRAYGLQNTVPNGFTAGGLPLGGLTIAEARGQLASRSATLNAANVRFDSKLDGGASRTAGFQSVGLLLNGATVEGALASLEEGSAFRRAEKRWKLRNAAITPTIEMNPDTYRKFVETAWAGLQSKQPVPARRVITDKDQVHIVPDIPVYRVDAEALGRLLLQADWLTVWREGGAAKKGEGPGQTGGAAALSIELPLTQVRAEATLESLTAQGVERKVAEFTTPILPGSEGRFHNISSAARTINERLMAPGEIFDYAPVIKETESRFGFQEAPVIFNGKLTPGIGGGICQVSSTLYNAVLRAGLQIVERRNHSLPVSYVPLGQDATFSEGYINFRFRNTTEGYLLIRTETAKDRMTVKLYGKLPDSVTYDIESVTVEELPAPVKTVVNPDMKPGRKETLQQGKSGYVVETYRTKKQNGTILSKELISKDRYQPQPTLVAVGGQVGPSSDGGPESGTNVIEDGVGGPRFR